MVKFFIILLMALPLGFSYADTNKFIDACGREVLIPEELTRLSAVGPASSALAEYTDYAYWLVTRDIPASIDKTRKTCSCAYPDNYDILAPVFRSYLSFTPDYQAINDAKPELIITTGLNNRQVEKLASSVNSTVAALNCSETGYLNYESIMQSLRLAGVVFDDRKNMQDIANFMARTRKELIDRTRDTEKKRVFILSQQYKDLKDGYTVEKCYIYLRYMNQRCIGSSTTAQTSYLDITFKELAEHQPEYIFVEYTMLERLKQDYAANKELFRSLPAVKNGKVFTILPYNRYSARYENLLINSYYIGTAMYPDLFGAENITTRADDISREFTGSGFFENVPQTIPVFKNLIFSEKGITIKK